MSLPISFSVFWGILWTCLAYPSAIQPTTSAWVLSLPGGFMKLHEPLLYPWDTPLIGTPSDMRCFRVLYARKLTFTICQHCCKHFTRITTCWNHPTFNSLMLMTHRLSSLLSLHSQVAEPRLNPSNLTLTHSEMLLSRWEHGPTIGKIWAALGTGSRWREVCLGCHNPVPQTELPPHNRNLSSHSPGD